MNNIGKGFLPSQQYTGSNKDLKLMPMPSSKLYNKNVHFYSNYSLLNEIKIKNEISKELIFDEF